MRTSYFVDLSQVVPLTEGSTEQWMHAFPFGQYKHPLYGDIIMTPERARRMALNVNEGVRGIDLAIDYDHNSGPAAGWIKQAEVRDDGLWLYIEWTPDAAERLRKKEYRYFSPEFTSAWTHPKTGVKYRDVLVGGGLTNRPFLKDLVPVNLSEVLGGEWTKDAEGNVLFNDQLLFGSSTGGNMELLKKLAAALGVTLADDATEDQMMEALTGAITKLQEPPTPPPTPITGLTETEVAALVEQHPQLKTLVEQHRADQTRIDALEAASKLSEANATLAEWKTPSADRKFGLPVSLNDEIRGFLLASSSAQATAFRKIVDSVLKGGLVPLGETRTVPRTPSDPADINSVYTEVEKEVAALRKAAKDRGDELSEAQALQMLFSEKPDLYDKYREASFAFTEGGEA